jgi:xanthine phosphoribosyltransferase
VLFVDDFLASGEAAIGAKKLIDSAGAVLAGVGIVIEKSFQSGPERLREEGIELYSLARIASMQEGQILFH